MSLQERTESLNQQPLRQRILSVCVHPPRMPGPGGAVRAYYFANALADSSELTLVCLGGPDGKEEIDSRIQAKCAAVITPQDVRESPDSSKPSGRLGSWTRTIQTILLPWLKNWSVFTSYCLQYCPDVDRGTSRSHKLLRFIFRNEFRIVSRSFHIPPVQVQLYQRAWNTLWPAIEAELRRNSFSCIFFENSIYFPLAKQIQQACPGVPIVCNAANIEYKLHERLEALSTTKWQQQWDHAQVQSIRKLESDAFRECDLVITCSEDDKLLARKLVPTTKCVVIGNGVDLDYFTPIAATAATAATVLLTGSFSYPPNQDGLEYFVNDIFPVICRERPDCHFVFAGFDAQDSFNRLNIRDERITCVSSPDDIRPCFGGASVFIVPLRIGGGTRLKIMEAMAMEIPIVSTRIGAEGIPAEDGAQLLLADSPEDFASAVLKLLNSNSLRQKMSVRASSWVRQNFDWNRLCEDAVDQIQKVIKNRPQI